jgi:hypothetical protein
MALPEPVRPGAARRGHHRLDAAASAQLEVCQQLRKLHLTVWYNLYAERLPDLRPRAAELLAQWPAP